MKRFGFYFLAVVLHAVILFGVKTSVRPPKTELLKKYLEVTLSAPPSLEPVSPQPEVLPLTPPPPPEPIPPLAPEPAPPPKVEEPIPQPTPDIPQPVSQPEPLAPSVPAPPRPSAPISQPSPQTVAAPVSTNAAPAAPPPGQYISVTNPSYLSRVEPDYPAQARRQHQEGSVTLALYINELGSLDKVEIVKSSGSGLLNEAAIEAMKESHFHPAYQGNLPVRSRAEVTVTFRLE